MLFLTHGFLFLFLPIAIALFYLTKRMVGEEISKLYLILVSLLFYGIYYPVFLLFLIVSVCFNAIIAILIKKTWTLSRVFFAIGVLTNLFALIFLKYSEILSLYFKDYFPKNVVALQLFIPLGIGFLTFNQISYLTGVYKEESDSYFNFDYCLKCTFFPSLIIGPLYDNRNVMVKEIEKNTTTFDYVAYGIYIVIIGLFKVVVLANSFYIYIFNGMKITSPGFLTAWLIVLSFTFCIYFSFSGYCDIAIGIGKMFGVNIGYNFLSPYKSISLTEFSERWHTSFVGIIKEVIYRPVISKYQNKLFQLIGIVSVSIVGSIWFGISPNVLLAGLIFGSLLFAENLVVVFVTRIPEIIRWAVTFLIINLLFVLIGTNSISQALNIYKGLVNFEHFGISQISDLTAEGSLYFPDIINVGYFMITLVLSIVICLFCKNTKEIIEEARLTALLAIGLGLLFLIVVIHIPRLDFLF